MSNIVFLLQPGFQLLDLAGPAQVFSSAANLGLAYSLTYLADTEYVASAQGVTVTAPAAGPELDRGDLIIVPGWSCRRLSEGPPMSARSIDLLHRHHAAGGTVASICSGAEGLGQAGLLDGRRCATHHEHQDELARRYPRATVVRDVLFTEDTGVVTSAGIASGIDLSLHLVSTRHGPRVAAQIARTMVIHTRRNGDADQDSAMIRHRAHLADQVHRVQDVIDTNFATTLRLSSLARRAGLSERTLTRKFASATGLTPLRYQQTLRVEHAEQLISQGSTIESAARAVGFEDARMLRRLRAAR